ncbi:hypothetical protein D3C83_202360 [compost metagenome]
MLLCGGAAVDLSFHLAKRGFDGACAVAGACASVKDENISTAATTTRPLTIKRFLMAGSS